MPGGSRLPDSNVYLVAAALAAIVAYYALTFRVDADELGIVMRFGKVTRLEPPGLHFRMPYPIKGTPGPLPPRKSWGQIRSDRYQFCATGGLHLATVK
jgi:modulator of FtsH protease HflK